MTGVQVNKGCRTCGDGPADFWVGNQGPLCARCSDDLIAVATGMPRLPDAPAPIVIDGPDGRRHVLRYRIWRAPTGILAQLLEEAEGGDGFEFAVLGAHDADVDDLVARVRVEAETGVARCYLEPGSGGGWQLAGDDVAGRLVWNSDGGPFRVVVDGRLLSWDELGEALSAFEGWRFRLLIDDPSVDARPDAVVLPLRAAGSGGDGNGDGSCGG